MIEPTQTPARSRNAASRVIDGEAVLILATSGDLIRLNAVATRVWELIAGQRSVQEITGAITEEYEVTDVQARTDVETFLSDLLNRDAITLD